MNNLLENFQLMLLVRNVFASESLKIRLLSSSCFMSFCLSVYLFDCNYLKTDRRIFMKSGIGNFH
jgi:hypothetical protein